MRKRPFFVEALYTTRFDRETGTYVPCEPKWQQWGAGYATRANAEREIQRHTLRMGWTRETVRIVERS